MKQIHFLLLTLFYSGSLSAQAITAFTSFDVDNTIPKDLTSVRSAVLIHLLPERAGNMTIQPDWKSFSSEVHTYLYRMSVDPVFYLNQTDLSANISAQKFYHDLLIKRGVKYLIMINEQSNGYELVCTGMNPEDGLIKNGQTAYTREASSLKEVMISFAKDIKRADHPIGNFLIPEEPLFLDEATLVEKLNLKNYPGQLRRSRLAVERFQEIKVPNNASDKLITKIQQHNSRISAMNLELESIMKEFPYEVVFIDYMSDENLLRNRHQFLLRNLHATGESIRDLLKYETQSGNSGYVSVIPIMPDNTTIKTIPRNALVYKFYIRQNIVKNVYVGEWDADFTWQDALRNYIRNMIQYFNKGN